MTTGLLEAIDVGPDIDARQSESLQETVAEALLAQTERAILGGADVAFEALDALEALAALRRLPPDRRQRLLLHPTFRYWLQAVRRTSRGDHGARRPFFVRGLASLVWSEQAVSGQLDRSWTVTTDERGGLRCPARGRFVELGPAYANQWVRVGPDEDRVVIQCADGLTIQVPLRDLADDVPEPAPTIAEHGYWVNVAPRVADGRIETWARDPWLRVPVTGTNQRTDGTEFFGVSEDQYLVDAPLADIEAALDVVRQYWPEALDDLARFSRVIVPLDASKFDPNKYHAFTVSSRQGAIYVGAAPPAPMVEMLLHENAHVKLRQIQELDTLLSDPLDESIRVSVPWRPDPRPLPGVFEGVYVFAHVAEFEWRRWQAAGFPTSETRFAELVRDLTHAREALAAETRFTRHGTRFFAAVQGWVDDLRGRAAGANAARNPV